MRLPRRLLTAVTLVVFFALGARAQALPIGPLAELQLQLDALSLHAPGQVGVMVEDLSTGYSSAINADAPMPAASTIKIPVMVEVFQQLARGDFDLNREVTLLASDRDWGWGDLAYAPIGSRYPVSRLLTLMIEDSDNTAANMLIRLVGRSAINREMAQLGLRHTALHDYIRSDGPIRSALRSSADDMIRLLDAMAHDRLIDPWSSREMLTILTGQHINTLLPVPLPPGTVIAHKTGSLNDTLDDVGIVFLDEAPYAIAVMTTDLASLDAGRQFIHDVSHVAYDALERFGAWREANLPSVPLVSLPSLVAPASTHVAGASLWAPSGAASAAPDDALPAAMPEPDQALQ